LSFNGMKVCCGRYGQGGTHGACWEMSGRESLKMFKGMNGGVRDVERGFRGRVESGGEVRRGERRGALRARRRNVQVLCADLILEGYGKRSPSLLTIGEIGLKRKGENKRGTGLS